MDDRRTPVSLTACAVVLIAGCASTPDAVELNARNTKIEPLYRVQQPAGTAAGQYAVGRLNLAEGRIDAAIMRFRNALTLEPDCVEALNGLGVAYGQQGRYEQAAEAFRAALATTPDAAYLLNNLGFAQMKAGRLQDAAESLKRALALDPRDVRTRENARQLIDARERANHEATVGVAAPASPGAAAPAAALGPAQAVELTMKPRVPAPVVAPAPAHVQEQPPMAQDRSPPVAQAAPAVVPAPPAQPAASASFEIVLARSGDGVLVQVAPGVYELRLQSATQQAASKPAPLPAAAATAGPEPAPLRTSLAGIGRLEVSNGAGTSRLATRTAQRLVRTGAGVAHVTNYRSYGQERTEIHYREGHAEDAKRLGERLPVDAKLVGSAKLRAGVDIRLVVGLDMAADDVAAWWKQTPEVARGDPGNGGRHL